jgi:FixJ family two-component response regulator
MMDTDAMVFVVDDDAPMRESLKNLMRSVGLRVEAFASAQEFLRSTRPEVPACLVLDVRLPGLSGLELQRQIVAANWQIPIIFITSHANDEARAQALEGGAVAFLYKPCREDDLLHAIDAALKQS